MDHHPSTVRPPATRPVRRHRAAFGVAAWGCLAAIGGLAAAGLAPLRAQGVTGRIVPSAPSVAPGGSITLTLDVAGVADLAGFQVGLTWDAAQLTLEAVTPGDWLASSGRRVEAVEPRVSPRSLDFLVYTLPPAPDDPRPGVDGGGVLATMRLRALATGRADVTLRQLLLTTTDNTPIIADLESAAFDIVAAPTPTPPRILLPYATLKR